MLSVALLSDGCIQNHLASKAQPGGGGSTLLGLVDRLLQSRGVEMGQVEGIYVGLGPGLFSGLRVGIATAKSLGAALGIPVAGACSVKVLAYGLAHSQERRSRLMALIDGRRGEVFGATYRVKKNTLEEETPLFCLTSERVVQRFGGQDYLVGGDGALAHYATLSEVEGFTLPAPEDSRHCINAAFLSHCAVLPQSYAPQQLATLVPIYYREPDAQPSRAV